MKKKFKIIFLYLFFYTFFFNSALAVEFKTRFGYYVNVPENYISHESPNLQKLFKENKKKEYGINKMTFEKVMTGNVDNDLVEVFFPKKKYNAEFNNIVLSSQPESKSEFNKFLKYDIYEICLTFKSAALKLHKKEVKLLDCEFNPEFIEKKDSPAIYFMKFEGLRKNYNSYFVLLEVKAQTSIFKARCSLENCSVILNDFIKIINSRKE